MGGKRLPLLISCSCCGRDFKPRSSTSKYCCVECQREARRKPKMTKPPSEKRCSKCGVIKGSKCFTRSGKSSDGLQSWCKQCNKERARKREYVYYQCEMCGGRFKRVRRSPMQEGKRSRKCLKCSRELALQKNGGHAHNYTGSEHFAGKMIAAWRSSAKRRKHRWVLTKEQLDRRFNEQRGICALSGLKMVMEKESPYRPSIDRIDSMRGYEDGNFQFVCSAVNVMKNKLPESEFVKLCRAISDNHK